MHGTLLCPLDWKILYATMNTLKFISRSVMSSNLRHPPSQMALVFYSISFFDAIWKVLTLLIMGYPMTMSITSQVILMG